MCVLFSLSLSPSLLRFLRPSSTEESFDLGVICFSCFCFIYKKEDRLALQLKESWVWSIRYHFLQKKNSGGFVTLTRFTFCNVHDHKLSPSHSASPSGESSFPGPGLWALHESQLIFIATSCYRNFLLSNFMNEQTKVQLNLPSYKYFHWTHFPLTSLMYFLTLLYLQTQNFGAFQIVLCLVQQNLSLSGS